jgi:hypothetical protein
MPEPTENAAPETTTGETPAAFDYDKWIAEQPDDVKAGLEQRTSGLTSALKSERESRKEQEKQLRDAAAAAEKGSEAQKQLTVMADKMAAADQRADFMEAAHAAGVKNLKLAYTVAREDEMFDRRGNVNFEAMKADYPELFGSSTAPASGNAGAGTTSQPAPGGKHAAANDAIRRAAGW